MSWLRSGKPWWIIAILALAAASTAYAVKHRQAKPPVQFETTAVDRGLVTARVTATGTLSALVTVQVGSQVSGRVQQILVDFNSPVKKGELIAKIDPQLFQAALEQARANYVAAQGNLTKAQVQAEQAQRDYKRTSQLAQGKLVSQADLDTAESNLASARAQVAATEGSVLQAKAALNQAQVNLAYTKIISPTDGVVISRNVDVGQTVAASLQAPTLFVIAEDLRKMQVDTSVAEADVGKLSPGMDATFVVDAFPGRPFKGTVRQIRNAAQTVQNVVTYDAVIDVNNEKLMLRPGMTANVSFVYANKENVLRVPNAALRFRPSSDLAAALNLDLGKPRHRGAQVAAETGGPAGERKIPVLPVAAGPNAAGPGRRGAGEGEGREGSGKDEERPGSRPAMASHEDEGLDRRTVWALRGGVPQRVSVKVGATDGSKTEVIAGSLAEGDLVITDATAPGLAKGPAGLLPGAPPPRRM